MCLSKKFKYFPPQAHSRRHGSEIDEFLFRVVKVAAADPHGVNDAEPGAGESVAVGSAAHGEPHGFLLPQFKRRTVNDRREFRGGFGVFHRVARRRDRHRRLHVAPKAGLALIPHGERTILRMRAGEIDLAIFPAVNLPADFQCLPLLKTPYVNVVRAGHPLEAKLKKGEVKAADLKPYRRIQICVYPDTDDTSGGVPGAATIPMKAGKTMIWTESWLGAVRIMHRSDAVLTLPWRTAKVLAEEHPLVVLSQERSVSWLEPALIWHEHMAADPGLQWVRSLIVTEIRGGLQPLVADEITLGRLGSA